MGRRDLSFNLGTCPSALKTVLPPAAPQGVTPSSRWLPIAQNPGQGLLDLTEDRRHGQIIGTQEPSDQCTCPVSAF